MSNSFNISSAVEIAALDAKVVLVDAVVDAIRATDVVNIQSNINDNETKIDTAITDISTVDGIVDDILIDTAAIPQNVRGKWNKAQLVTTSATLVELLNVSGHGILKQLVIQCANSGDTITLRVTLDGIAWENLTHTGDIIQQIIQPSPKTPAISTGVLVKQPLTSVEVFFFDYEFNASCLIEISRSAGTNDNVQAKVFYILDQF